MLLTQSAPGASGYLEKEKSTAPSGDQWRCLCPRQGMGCFLVIEAAVQLKIPFGKGGNTKQAGTETGAQIR